MTQSHAYTCTSTVGMGVAAAGLMAGYGSASEEGATLRELLLAIGLPLALVLLAVLALEQWGDHLPPWLQRLSERPSWLWNAGVGLIIGLSLLRWWLRR